MLGEAWGRRRYIASFVNKIDEAIAEVLETQAWLDHALDAAYLTDEEHRSLEADTKAIAAMLFRMIDRAKDFCKYAPDTDYRLKEEEDDYMLA